MLTKQSHTDIIKTGWIGRMPNAVRPYLYLMRLDRPIGTWLLLLPALWSILLVGGLSAWPVMVLFAIGAIIMRGAGCVINDLWDRDLDGSVERTATRPLPNGDVTPKQALLFLIILLSVGLFILLQFNIFTITLGIVSIVFVVTYPLMKRITWWPQAFLGLTFNFGALMGWSAMTGDLGLVPILLYIAGIFWTLGYDTIYALQDRDDDALIGVKSSARYVMERGLPLKPILMIFYAVHFGILMTAIVMVQPNNGNPLWLWGLWLLPLMHLIWQGATVNTDTPMNALKRFKSNRDYGVLVCGVVVVFSVFYS